VVLSPDEELALVKLMLIDERYGGDARNVWPRVVAKAEQWQLTPTETAARLVSAAIRGLGAEW